MNRLFARKRHLYICSKIEISCLNVVFVDLSDRYRKGVPKSNQYRSYISKSCSRKEVLISVHKLKSLVWTCWSLLTIMIDRYFKKVLEKSIQVK